MKFPNAAKGVKKLFASQVLSIIATASMIIAAIIGLIALAAASVPEAGAEAGAIVMGAGSLVFIAIFSVLSVIALIFELVGIIQCKKDEESFTGALVFLIIQLIASGALSFTTSLPVVSSICNSVSSLMSIFVIIMIISGIMKLADALDRSDISEKGSTILKLIVIVACLSLIASIITAILGGSTASIVAGIIALAAYIISFVQYVLYLVYLAKARKMLNA